MGGHSSGVPGSSCRNWGRELLQLGNHVLALPKQHNLHIMIILCFAKKVLERIMPSKLISQRCGAFMEQVGS